MAKGQDGKGSTKSSSRETRKHHSGRKWYFAKERNGDVRTLYAHNKSPILAQDGCDPGRVLHIKCTDDSSKIKVKYSSDKSLLLDLTFFSATDDLNKRLFLEISNVSKFGELASELLEVEFCEPRAGKRKSAVDNENEKTKRPRSKTNSSAISPISTEVNQSSSADGPSHAHAVSTNVSANTLTTIAINSNAASTSQSTSNGDNEDVLVDSSQLRYAISLHPQKVLVSSLQAPRKAYMLRDIDNLFVKSLIREFKENEVLFGLKPLLVIVKGLKTPGEFKEEMLDSYELEVIGGNHRRSAMQAIQRENPACSQYEYTEAVLFSEMPKGEVLKIAYKHNRMDRFHHEMTTQEKVKLCHSILQDEFGGQKTAEWKSYCSAVINSKESLEFIFLLSGLDKQVFTTLENVFKTFEAFKIKDQTSSVSQAKKLLSGAMQQPNLVASKFKCIRGLNTDHLTALLAKIADGELSFSEMKIRATEIKSMAALKTEFVKKTGCESWEEALKRFPDFTSEELLQQFIGSVHKRKADGEFLALVERALQAEVSSQDNSHSTLCKINGMWYCALRSEEHKVTSELLRNVPFNGADLTVIQEQQTWCEEKYKSVVRQVCGQNTRSKLSNYVIVVRNKSDAGLFEGCTSAGKGHIMYVAWSGMSAKASTGLTNAVEKMTVIFVGTTLRSVTNWYVAKTEEDLMRHLMEEFVPPRGTLLDLATSQVSSPLIPALECKVNLLGIYDKQETVNAFNVETTKLSHARSLASDTDME